MKIFIFRATVIIKCDMDFVLYPLDVQECAVDFSSCELQYYLLRNITFFRVNVPYIIGKVLTIGFYTL